MPIFAQDYFNFTLPQRDQFVKKAEELLLTEAQGKGLSAWSRPRLFLAVAPALLARP